MSDTEWKLEASSVAYKGVQYIVAHCNHCGGVPEIRQGDRYWYTCIEVACHECVDQDHYLYADGKTALEAVEVWNDEHSEPRVHRGKSEPGEPPRNCTETYQEAWSTSRGLK